MTKKIVVEYWGTSRGNKPMHLGTQTFTQAEWEKEDKDTIEKEAQEAALDYFEVSGWCEVKYIEVEND